VQLLNNSIKKEDLIGLPFCNIDIVYLYCYNEEVNRITGGLCMGILMHYIGMAISLFFAYQVYKDAKARGNKGAIFWAIGTFLAWIVILPIYWFKHMRD
jgi:hypothetical protein